MAHIIYLHKRTSGLKVRERTFEPADRDATILMFTGVRYERKKQGVDAAKPRSKRAKVQ